MAKIISEFVEPAFAYIESKIQYKPLNSTTNKEKGFSW